MSSHFTFVQEPRLCLQQRKCHSLFTHFYKAFTQHDCQFLAFQHFLYFLFVVFSDLWWVGLLLLLFAVKHSFSFGLSSVDRCSPNEAFQSLCTFNPKLPVYRSSQFQCFLFSLTVGLVMMTYSLNFSIFVPCESV